MIEEERDKEELRPSNQSTRIGKQIIPQTGTRESPQRRARFTQEHQIMLNLMIEARKKAGLSQAQLAGKIGKFQAHVASIEVGGRDINAVELYRWCLAVELPIVQFFQNFEEELHRQK